MAPTKFKANKTSRAAIVSTQAKKNQEARQEAACLYQWCAGPVPGGCWRSGHHCSGRCWPEVGSTDKKPQQTCPARWGISTAEWRPQKTARERWRHPIAAWPLPCQKEGQAPGVTQSRPGCVRRGAETRGQEDEVADNLLQDNGNRGLYVRGRRTACTQTKETDQVRYGLDWSNHTVLRKMTWRHEVVYSMAGKQASYQDISIPQLVHGYLLIMEGEEVAINETMRG